MGFWCVSGADGLEEDVKEMDRGCMWRAVLSVFLTSCNCKFEWRSISADMYSY